MRIFALSLGLGVSEWLRGLLFTGFPWNDIGMSLGDNLVLAQIASVVGLHGLTFIAIAIFAAPATLWSLDDGRLRLGPTAWAALALALIAGVGLYRLDTPASPTVPGVKLRIMQPNVSQGSDFSPENKEALLERYFALSDRATAPDRTGVADVTHLIWPESAFPFILSRDADALAEITEFLRGGAVLITGAARMEEGPDRRAHYFNSIEILNRNGLSSERYDKRHLVPFGEYLPFASLFERAHITQFVDIPGGFDAGVGRAVLRVPGLPVALPLICYEAIFPNEIGAVFSSSPRPAWMLNVTDDTWFGSTPGPYQHFAQARLRSIEQGLPLVRAANSGVSAVIDGYGRILASAPLGVEGVLDASLPKPLASTWQYRWGSLSALAIAIVFLSISLVGRRRR
jgi:apolipoprotein N-acyltransferase